MESILNWCCRDLAGLFQLTQAVLVVEPPGPRTIPVEPLRELLARLLEDALVEAASTDSAVVHVRFDFDAEGVNVELRHRGARMRTVGGTVIHHLDPSGEAVLTVRVPCGRSRRSVKRLTHDLADVA
ncbi:MAG: hypothetical protein AAGA56_14580 [Myxococcota bacterium]